MYPKDTYTPARIGKVLAEKNFIINISQGVLCYLRIHDKWLFRVHISAMFPLKFPECFMKMCVFSMRLVMYNLFSLQISFKKLSYHCLTLL